MPWSYGSWQQSPDITWDIRNWPNPNNAADLSFGFYNVLHAHPAPVIASDLMVTVANITQDPTLEAFVPANLPNNEKIRLREDLRRIRFVTPGGLPRSIQLNADLAFTTDTVVEPILVARNQGRHDFRLVSTARVYQLPAGGAPSAGQAPLATRVIEARVKESSFDYAHFIAKMGVPGMSTAKLRVTASRSPIPTIPMPPSTWPMTCSFRPTIRSRGHARGWPGPCPGQSQ